MISTGRLDAVPSMTSSRTKTRAPTVDVPRALMRPPPGNWTVTTPVATSITVPDHLGGWHAVLIVQNGSIKAQVPYYVERSLISLSAKTVRAGEPFTIHLKGIGWTELDNTFAVTYDNGYIGYACGFYSKGDVTMNMVATGAPGTHLIDLYPALYKGKATDTWLEQMPMLSFRQDAPGLALGYRLPAFHLAITVTK